MNLKIPIDCEHPTTRQPISPTEHPTASEALLPAQTAPSPRSTMLNIPEAQDSALASHQDPEITPVTGLAHGGLLGLGDNYSGSHDEGTRDSSVHSGDHQMVGLGALDLQEIVLIECVNCWG